MSPPLPKSPAFGSSNARLGGASPDQNRVSRRLSTLVKNVPSVVNVKTSHLGIVQRTFPVFRSQDKNRSRSAPPLNPLPRISDAYAVNGQTSTQAIRNVRVVLREAAWYRGITSRAATSRSDCAHRAQPDEVWDIPKARDSRNRAAAPILSQGHRSIDVHPSAAQRRGPTAEYPATQDVRLYDTSGETGVYRCSDRLNRHCLLFQSTSN